MHEDFYIYQIYILSHLSLLYSSTQPNTNLNFNRCLAVLMSIKDLNMTKYRFDKCKNVHAFKCDSHVLFFDHINLLGAGKLILEQHFYLRKSSNSYISNNYSKEISANYKLWQILPFFEIVKKSYPLFKHPLQVDKAKQGL